MVLKRAADRADAVDAFAFLQLTKRVPDGLRGGAVPTEREGLGADVRGAKATQSISHGGQALGTLGRYEHEYPLGHLQLVDGPVTARLCEMAM